MRYCANKDCQLFKKHQVGENCTKCARPLREVTSQDLKDAARYCVAWFPRCRAADSSGTIRTYCSITGSTFDPEQVLELADQKRRVQRGLDYVDNWSSTVCNALFKARDSAFFKSVLLADRAGFLAKARDKVSLCGLAGNIRTEPAAQFEGGVVVVPTSMLTEDLNKLAFTLGHETGHLVDYATRDTTKAPTPMHHALRLGHYGDKPHDPEYFADAFATLVLLLGGIQSNSIVEAARALFADDNSNDHPPSRQRVDNVQAVANRHLGLTTPVVATRASEATAPT